MRSVALVIVAGLLLAGCGGGDEEAVKTVFQRLDAAQARGDAETACEKVFLVAAEEEAGESPEACRAAFAAAAATRRAQVRELRTSVRTVKVEGDEARATLRSEVTRADGSRFTNEYQRELVRRDGRWRIRISPEG